MKKTIAVDLDGVLAQYSGWQGLEHFGRPLPYAGQFMERLKSLGHVMVYTTRTNASCHPDYSGDALVSVVKDWLDKYNIPYDRIYEGEGKPIASAYVDDRAVTCRPQDDGPHIAYDLAYDAVEELVA